MKRCFLIVSTFVSISILLNGKETAEGLASERKDAFSHPKELVKKGNCSSKDHAFYLDHIIEQAHSDSRDLNSAISLPGDSTFLNVIDSLTLVELYRSTAGDNWTYNTNWMTGPVNSWHGIEVIGGVIEEIHLNSNNLTGSIPPEIGNLTSLRYLNLYDNQLSGSIPSEMGNLTSLTVLYLNNNDLSATTDLSTLQNLSSSYFRNNRFNFYDLEILNIEDNGQFYYAAQDTLILYNDTLLLSQGDNVLLDVKEIMQEKEWSNNNEYIIYKGDSIYYDWSSSSEFAFTSADTGTFMVQVKNNNFPLLTLISEPFTISLSSQNFSPTDLILSNTLIAENAGVGSTIGELNALDKNAGDTFTYSFATGDGINDIDNASFYIEGQELKTLDTLDYETKNTYHVYIQVSDTAGLTYEKAFLISVRDVFEAHNALFEYSWWIDEDWANTNFVKVSPDSLLNIGDNLQLDSLSAGIHSYSFRAKGLDGLYSSVFSRLFYKLQPGFVTFSDTIKSMEYWIDNNDHVFTQDIYSPSNYAFLDSLILDTIAPGIHSFNFRVKDVDGLYSAVLSHLFFKRDNELIFSADSINHLEYWIDNSDNVFTQEIGLQSEYTFMDSLTLDTLSAGIHSINVRFKSNSSLWSSTSSHLFYKSEAFESTLASAIKNVEYWVDDDSYRYTAATPLNSDIVFIDSLKLDSLSSGIHSFRIRFIDNNGKWSSVLTHMFFKIAPELVPTSSNITYAEYWIDNSSYRMQQQFAESNNIVMSDILALDTLENGIHSLNVRFKDDHQRWSSAMSHLFYKVPGEISSEAGSVVSYRIIYDNDPSLSQYFNIGDNTANPLIMNTTIPAPLMEVGEHIVSLQFKDSNGLWSSVYSDTILTDSIPQTIELVSGWNLVSLNIIPTDREMIKIVTPLIQNNQLVKVQDETGSAIEQIPGQEIWADEIGLWQETEGYRVNVPADTMLTVYGDLIPLPVKIPLRAGWNIISYPPRTGQSVMRLVDTLIAHSSFEKIQDETGKSVEFIPGTNILINNVNQFEVDKGYLVRVNRDDSVFIYDSWYSADPYKKATESKNYGLLNPVWTGNGYNHMNIYVMLSESQIQLFDPGDELAVFDGDLCVGATVLDDMQEPYISIVTSADDPGTIKKDGFTPGNQIMLKVLKNGYLKEIDNLTFSASSDSVFSELGTGVIHINDQELSADKFQIISALNYYPNPFSDILHVDYYLQQEAEITIRIYNMMGSLIHLDRSRGLKGKNKFSWIPAERTHGSMLDAGVYIIQISNAGAESLKTLKAIKL